MKSCCCTENATECCPTNETHHHHDHNHDHHHHSFSEGGVRAYLPAIFSLVLLLLGISLDYFGISFFKGWLRIAFYILAYLSVALPVLRESWESVKKGDVFTEFFLMSLATVGAFAIGEYPEGVAVMLFYTIGEYFQDAAVDKAKGNIKALLDVQAKVANVFRGGVLQSISPQEVTVGERLQVLVGEKIPLDGVLLSDKAVVNTAALTGESTPAALRKGAEVFAGSINLENVIEVTVTKKFEDTSLARILDLVQNATARKSKTELFIRKFARVYTPIVVLLALGVAFLPYFFVENYVFAEWLYRALIFLVISCPCALVISIPLGYFGGVGAASRNGILFKGTSFLDTITRVNTVVMDKTGTLTKGVFKIKEIHGERGEEQEFMDYLAAIEKQSTHPIAKAILEYSTAEKYTAERVEEIAGQGLKGLVNGKEVLAGNKALLSAQNISVPAEIDEIVETVVLMAIDGKFAGYVLIADEVKNDAQSAIRRMKKVGVKNVMMLSGDKMFGDGINDAPVLALSDIGIAMGGLGSDVAIETADVIIQTDQPSKLVTAIQIGKTTRKIVWQNILFAFGVKILVMLLGASGLATMWEAVFADVGVALLAILNAVRLQRMRWE